MTVSACCPECGTRYRVAEGHVGRSTSCKSCGKTFVLQTLPPGAAPAAGEPSPYSAPTALFEPAVPLAELPGKPLPSMAGDVTAAWTPAEPGEQVSSTLGRFRIRRRLGAGAFGTVYQAYDPLLDREVALKVPHLSRLQNEEDRTRTAREAKAAAQLRHPNIVPVYDAGVDGDRFYIASAFIEGQTLAEYLKQHTLAFNRAAEIVGALSAALGYAHGLGIVHRDVKPGNVLLDAKGNPLLTDFGLARFLESDDELTHDGTVLGTPAYMSPEQAKGEQGKVGPASDQYSLGVVLYELLCDQRPFFGPAATVIADVITKEPPSPRSLVPAIPKDLATICQKAMAKDPRHRYPSCEELADDLRRWQEVEPIHARRMGSTERLWRWAKRKPLLAGLAVAVLVLAMFSTTVAVGLFMSGQKLDKALAGERRQTKLAKQQAILLAEESRHSKEQEEIAKRNEARAKKSEREAIAQTQRAEKALADRDAAEAEKKAEAEQRTKIAEELHQQGAKLKDVQHDAIDNSAWIRYTKQVVAADAALQAKEKDLTRIAAWLDDCPKEHRAWEWHYLRSLCKGMQPSVHHLSSRGKLQVTPNAEWLLRIGPDPSERRLNYHNLEVCKLPDSKPIHTCVLSGTPYLSPSGKHILMARIGGFTLYDVSSGKLDENLPRNGLFLDRLGDPFSPDGTRILVRDSGDGHSGFAKFVLLGTGKPVVVTPKFPADASDRSPPHLRGRFMLFTPKGRLVQLMGRVNICEIAADGTPRLPMKSLDLGIWESSSRRVHFSTNEKRAAVAYEDIASNGPGKATSRPTTRRTRSAESPTVFIYNAENSHPELGWVPFYAEDGTFVSLSPDGKRVALFKNGSISIWSISPRQKLPILRSISWCCTEMSEDDSDTRIVMSPDWTHVAMWESPEEQEPDFDEKGSGFFYWSIPAPLDVDYGD